MFKLQPFLCFPFYFDVDKLAIWVGKVETQPDAGSLTAGVPPPAGTISSLLTESGCIDRYTILPNGVGGVHLFLMFIGILLVF